MNQVLKFYEQARNYLQPLLHDEKYIATSAASLSKNKAIVYKELLDNYPEFWYTGSNDREYDNHVAMLTYYLE